MLTQPLDGAWELRKSGSDDVIIARVPGCVHLDLMHSNVIEDPFHGDNEFRVAWVHETDWEYTRTFEADPGLFGADRVFLECDGLDTIADLSLNGEPLGRADNMYVQHRYDVTDRLRQGENSIAIRFTSPVNFARPWLEQDPCMSPGDSIPGSVYTRKCPSQWGWDWGPKIPTSGIWRPIRLAAYNTARIEDVWVRQKHSQGRVMLNIEVSLEQFAGGDTSVAVRLVHPDGRAEEREVAPEGGTAGCTIDIADPMLWWPNGYGEQPLYRVEAVLKEQGREVHVVSRKIGLRSIELEQKADEFGRGFTFVVNGVAVFCKGADWIPADQFPPRITDEHYRHLIRSAAQANMNMLRIWGGGFYEDERFYDLCDEYGILIWQDFMFSCAHYPVLDWYLDNIREDVEHNVIRLRGRACIALWCGNNEMEWFLAGGWGGDKNAQRKDEYVKIFHELIPAIVEELDPDTSYWPSSPSSGDVPFDDPNGQDRGDGHYWEVWHGRAPFTAYRSQFHRFMSEFGFESMPDIETVRSFAREEDLNMTSYVMECHQKNRAGNGLILYYLAQTFRFPRDFEMMCYVSQLLQAEAMRYGVEHWRRNRGRCLGALYWQLNDCWPVSSWASIDYFGRWKALQYFAKRFYAPVMLSVAESGTRAEIHLTNDTTRPVDAEVRWSLEKLDGAVVRADVIRARVDGESNTMFADLDFSAELAGDVIRQCVLVHELLIDGKAEALGVTPFVPSKHLELPRADIRVAAGSDGAGPYLDVTSDALARFVRLSVPGRDVVFSDNYFDLPAGRTVRVRVESDIDPAALSRAAARSLRDSY